MSLRLAQQYLTEHTEPTDKNNLNFMNPSAASYLLNYGRPVVYTYLWTSRSLQLNRPLRSRPKERQERHYDHRVSPLTISLHQLKE